jgi:hypothetical protein
LAESDEDASPPPHGPGDILRYRLERKSSWGAQAGCATAIGLLLTGLGSFFIYLEVRADDVGLGTVVGGAFALVGLLVLGLGGVHQLWARAQTAETFFEMDTLAVKRGEPARFCVVQPGPADFQSLRVKVVCERTMTKRRTDAKGETTVDQDVRLVHDHCALDLTDVHVGRGSVWHHEATLIAPKDQPPSGGDDPSHEWRIEIWGRVRRGPDVMHPFVIDVD